MPTGYVAIAVAAPRDPVQALARKAYRRTGLLESAGASRSLAFPGASAGSSSNPEAAFRLLEWGEPDGELAPQRSTVSLPLRLANEERPSNAPGSLLKIVLSGSHGHPELGAAFLTEQQRGR